MLILSILFTQTNRCGRETVDYQKDTSAIKELAGAIAAQQKLQQSYIQNLIKKIHNPNKAVSFKIFEQTFKTCPLVAALLTEQPETLAPFFDPDEWEIPINFNFQDKDGNTPLHHALNYVKKQNEHYALKTSIDLLLDQKSLKVNIANHNGVTPLMLAAARGEPSYFDRLLYLGADITTKDNQGVSVFEYALDSAEQPNPVMEMITDTEMESNEATFFDSFFEEDLPRAERAATPYYFEHRQEQINYTNPLFTLFPVEEIPDSPKEN